MNGEEGQIVGISLQDKILAQNELQDIDSILLQSIKSVKYEQVSFVLEVDCDKYFRLRHSADYFSIQKDISNELVKLLKGYVTDKISKKIIDGTLYNKVFKTNNGNGNSSSSRLINGLNGKISLLSPGAEYSLIQYENLPVIGVMQENNKVRLILTTELERINVRKIVAEYVSKFRR